MKRQIATFFIFVLLIVGGISVYSFSKGSILEQFPSRSIILRSPSGHESVFQVEVAATPTAREQGLMFRKTVVKGMLFLFDSAQTQTFWMKNTLVPLDIMFFGSDGSFVSSTSMTPCVSDPCKLYTSAVPARYALEMPAGFVASNVVKKGWKFILPAVGRRHSAK